MPEYEGPGKYLWSMHLSKTVRPAPDFSVVVLDRGHRHLATFNGRVVYVVDLEETGKGKVLLQVSKSIQPATRAFSHLAWCMNDETPELLAAVLGTDILIFNATTQEMRAHLKCPHARSLHTPPLAEWGGVPCSLITAGNDGMLKLWKVTPEGRPYLQEESLCLKNHPHTIMIHPTKAFLASYEGSVVQVWSTKDLEQVLERDFLTPIRSIAWSVTKQTHLLVLYHRDGERRINAPVLAELDLHNNSFTEEPSHTHNPHPLAGIATVRLHPLPIPFAPKLLFVAYSSHRFENSFLRLDTDDGVAPQYEQLTPFFPAQGIRYVSLRRVDGERERGLHLIVLYSTGVLVSRLFQTKPMDLLLDKQIRLLQERRDVEVVKIQSAGAVLESIKLRVRVPTDRVPFLEQTHHSTKHPPAVFFEATVKQGDQMPEVAVSNNCIRGEHELSLEDGLLESIAMPMREAILGAVRENKPWLPCMVDACHAQLMNMGSLQPSQLKKMPSPHARAQTFPRPILRSSGGHDGTPVHRGSQRSASSIDTDVGRNTHATPPSSLGDVPFLPVQSSPQICYKRAYVVQPRYSGAVFAPDGSLLCFGHDREVFPEVSMRTVPGEEPLHRWCLTGLPADCAYNASITPDEGERIVWLSIKSIVSLKPNKSSPLVKMVGTILKALIKAKRYYLMGAVAVMCLAHCGKEPLQDVEPAIFHLKKPMSLPVYQPALKSMSSPVISITGAMPQEVASQDKPFDTCAIPYDLRVAAYSAISMLMQAAAACECPTLETEASLGLWLLGERLGLTMPNDYPLQLMVQNPVHDSDVVLRCSVCKAVMRGLSMTCVKCGHMAHLKCQMEWYSSEAHCPLGCGCECVFTA